MVAMIGAIHSVTRATVRIPPKMTIAEKTKIRPATVSCAAEKPPAPGRGCLAASPKALVSVPAMALDCTEVMTIPQVTTVITAKTLARTRFFIPRLM